MYEYYNANPLGLYEDDCVIRAVSCATNKSWNEVYDELSDIAQANGTLLDKKQFVIGYLDAHYKRISIPPHKVYEIAQMFKDNIVLCATQNHLLCIRYGCIYDTFNPSSKTVMNLWVVK